MSLSGAAERGDFQSAIRRAFAQIAGTARAVFKGAKNRNAAAAANRETTISETSKLCGVPLRTLLAYEDRWLIRPRLDGDIRFYSGFDRVRIQMIADAERQGCTLTEIARLIGTRRPDREGLAEFEGRLEPYQISALLEDDERRERSIDDAVARLRAAHELLMRRGGS